MKNFVKKISALVIIFSLSNTFLNSCGIIDGFTVDAYIPASLCCASIYTDDLSGFQTPKETSYINADIAVLPVIEGAEAILYDKWDYSLVSIPESSNLLLIDISEKGYLNEEDCKIAIPPLYKSEKMYAENSFKINEEQLLETEDIRSCQRVLTTGKYDDQKISAVIMPNPFAYLALNDYESELKEFKIEFPKIEGNYIGVFFSNEFLGHNQSDSILSNINKTTADLAQRNGSETFKSLYKIGSLDSISKFGATAQIYRELFLGRFNSQLSSTNFGFNESFVVTDVLSSLNFRQSEIAHIVKN